MESSLVLAQHRRIVVKQIYEVGEWFGFETRNKYQVLDESSQLIAYVAEQQKGFWGFVLRQLLGHWRSFEFHFFSPQRLKVASARQPFRFFFQRLEVFDQSGRLQGALQQRWAIFSKRFDVENAQGGVMMEMSSPIFRIWTFPFMRHGREVARIEKKWGGVLTEVFTDTDKFQIQFPEANLGQAERLLVLAAALFIDLRYFENKANTSRGAVLDM